MWSKCLLKGMETREPRKMWQERHITVGSEISLLDQQGCFLAPCTLSKMAAPLRRGSKSCADGTGVAGRLALGWQGGLDTARWCHGWDSNSTAVDLGRVHGSQAWVRQPRVPRTRVSIKCIQGPIQESIKPSIFLFTFFLMKAQSF